MQVIERERGTSRAHAVKLRVGFSVLADTIMGSLKSLDESCPGIVAGFVIEGFLDRLDRQAARFLPSLVAAHSVSNNGQSSLLLKIGVALGFPIGKSVFIILALAADIRQAGHLDPR